MKIKNYLKLYIQILLLTYFFFHSNSQKIIIIPSLHSYIYPNIKIRIIKFISFGGEIT